MQCTVHQHSTGLYHFCLFIYCFTTWDRPRQAQRHWLLLLTIAISLPKMLLYCLRHSSILPPKRAVKVQLSTWEDLYGWLGILLHVEPNSLQCCRGKDYYVYQGIVAEHLSIAGISQEGLHSETFPPWAAVLKTQLETTGKE